MPKLQMTDAAVKRITAAPGERSDYFDAHARDRQRGLVLRVSGHTDKEGERRVTRTWAVMCRIAGSATLRRITIGDYPTYSLAQARDAAAEIIKNAKRGIDDAVEKKKAIVAAGEAEEATKRNTIAAVFTLWVEKHLKAKHRAPRYIEEAERTYRLHVEPKWGKRDIRSITRREAIDLLEEVAEGKGGKGGPVQANRTLGVIRPVFNFAIRRGIIESSPLSMIEPPGAETKRDRDLKAEELKTLWPAMAALEYPAGPYLRMLLATGQRRSEVAGMRWDDLDLKERTWTLSAEQTKAGRAHVVPLSPLAVAIIESVPRIRGPYVFAGTGRRSPKRDAAGNTFAGQACPISGFAKIKQQIDAKAQLAPWRLHDLRRTAATHMARLGISQFVIARVLNHADRSVTGIYNRYEYLAEKRHALEVWSGFLDGLTKPRSVSSLAEERARRAMG